MIKKLIAIGLVAGFWLGAGSAHAITPGNLSLENVATLTYTGNAAGIEARAEVTVNVIATAPTLSTVSNIVKAESQAITNEATYTVTANNNGFDNYTFEPSTLTSGAGLTDTSSGGANVNFTGVSYTYKDSGGATITQIGLGATALDTLSTASTSISVPSDGTLDTAVNGLTQGDKVLIGAVEYTIVDPVNDTGTGSVTLVLNAAVPANLPVGTGVFERTTFTVETTNVGNQTVAGLSTTYDVTTTLQTTLVTPAQVTATQTFQVEIVNITIVKYVANISLANCTGTCTAESFDAGDGGGSIAYYLTDGTGNDVAAQPGQTLSYLIRVTTPASGTLANAAISDVLANFTSFVSGSLSMNGQAVDDEGTGNNTDGNASGLSFPLDSATDGGGLLIQTGTPTTSGEEGDGNVTGGSTVNIVYRVTLS